MKYLLIGISVVTIVVIVYFISRKNTNTNDANDANASSSSGKSVPTTTTVPTSTTPASTAPNTTTPPMPTQAFFTTAPPKLPINCDVSAWGNWSACSNEGKQTRSRTVTTNPLNGGAACGPLTETQNCPVNCAVSAWGDWSACNNGTKTRTRTITTNPLNGGTACEPLTETQNCPINCAVSDWGIWGNCINGTKTRTRTITTNPANGGAECPALTDSQTCTNCAVSDWGNWSDCVGCDGGGKKTRTRTVTANPVNGGTECPVLTESQNCVNNEPCANDPECSFIRSDADLKSAQNINTNVSFPGCGGTCGARTYIKCGKTSGGHYIKTSQYNAYLNNINNLGVYAGDPISIPKSTMALRNGEKIFGPCGNCPNDQGSPFEGGHLNNNSSQPKCMRYEGSGFPKESSICENALMAKDRTGATPPPNPKPDMGCNGMLWGTFCV